MKNAEIAKVFYQIADLLELLNEKFKPNAYRKAARMLENLDEDIEQIVKERKLRDLDSIGDALAGKIEEYVKTGKIKYLEDLKKKIPGNLADLLNVPGLGPKRVVILNKELKINSLKDLELAATQGKIRTLDKFGEKSEKDILDGIILLKKGTDRMLYDVAFRIAKKIVSKLKDVVNKIEIAGSLRRKKPTIGDIDLLATSNNPKKVIDYFTTIPEVDRILGKGKTKSSILLKNGKQVDLRVVDEKSFGAALLYFTGNKDHNIKLRNIAIKKGLKLSEYGLFTIKDNKMVAGKTEKEVYNALGLNYINPELRENKGEIEKALK